MHSSGCCSLRCPHQCLPKTRRRSRCTTRHRSSSSADFDWIQIKIASPDEIRAKIKPAVTDPGRVRRNDPGDPEVCPVYTWYQKFMPGDAAETAAECRSAARGCVDCKQKLADGVIAHFAPLREKRAQYEAHPQQLDEIIAA